MGDFGETKLGRELAEAASDYSHNYACIILKLPSSTIFMPRKAMS